MKFECGDLERALAVPELMAEAREHLKECAACRREYRLWTEISSVAKELHEEWESPDLWPNIRQTLEAQQAGTPLVERLEDVVSGGDRCAGRGSVLPALAAVHEASSV